MFACVSKKAKNTYILSYEKISQPKVPKSGVLIKNYAASINPRDCKLLSGKLRLPFTKPPHIPGFDFSGVVEVAGKESEFNLGDQVWGMLDMPQIGENGGSFSEYIACDDRYVTLKPTNLNFIEAASLPLVSLASIQSFLDIAKIQPGMQLLINGASTAVGLIGVQIAKLYGCSVSGVASHTRFDLCKKMGYDAVIDYEKCNILEKKQTYDIWFDVVSNQSFNKIRHQLKPKGFYISTVGSFKAIITTLLSSFTNLLRYQKACPLIVEPNKGYLKQLKTWVEEKKVSPVIDTIFSLKEGNKALEMSRTGHVCGKIVLEIH